MKATTPHGPCRCNCGQYITPGAHFVIIEGEFFLSGHETGDCLKDAGLSPPPDYSRLTSRTRIDQKPITDLPLFGEPEPARQLELFI